ncbi:MAG: hypothetical protein B6U95_09835, partial [Thermofilum sp. ex4484_82]
KYFNVLKGVRKSLKTTFLVILGFIPEILFMVLYFSVLMPYLAVIGIITGALVGNSEFVTFLEKYFNVPLET